MIAGEFFRSKPTHCYELSAQLHKKHAPYGVLALPEVPSNATRFHSQISSVDQVQPASVKSADSGGIMAGVTAPAPDAKKYVFTPKPKATERFADDNLEFNNSLM